jgi:cell division protein FtsL
MAPAAPATAPRRAPAKRSPAGGTKRPAKTRSAAKAPTRTPPAARAQRNSRAIANARATQRAAAAPATRTAPARRKSGPATRPARARPTTAPSPVARVLQARGMPLIDRLLRGPAWVVIVGALLAGIVFLNVSVLELNRGIAKTDAQAGVLERVNSGLRARVAKLDSGERIQQLAADRGFVMPQPGDVTFVKPRSSDARLAAQRIKPPAAPATDATGTTSSTTGTTSLTTGTAIPPAQPTATTAPQQQPAQAAPVAGVTPTPPPSTGPQAP